MRVDLGGWIPPAVARTLRAIRRSMRRLQRERVRDRTVARRRSERTTAETRLHLGCGGNVIAGWTNLDIEATDGALTHDLTTPLPFPSESVALIYSEHFIEHISREQGEALLGECSRVLVRGGVIRISTPDLETIVDRYRKKELSEWEDVGWAPASACAMLNGVLRSWGHQYVYDFDELREVLSLGGFHSVRRVGWGASSTSGLCDLESRPHHGDLIVEATR